MVRARARRFAGDDDPRTVVPAVVGRTRKNRSERSCKTYMLVKKPKASVIFSSWNTPSTRHRHQLGRHGKIWTTPKRAPSLRGNPLLTELPQATTVKRLAQVMFETFNCPAMHVPTKPLLNTYYAGRSAAGRSQRLDLAGRDLTHHLMGLLSERDYALSPPTEKSSVTSKRSCATLPSTSSRRWQWPPPPLSRGLTSFPTDSSKICGIHEAVTIPSMNCDIDLRGIYCGIILTGGTTLIPDSPEDEEGNHCIAPSGIACGFMRATRGFGAWIGALFGFAFNLSETLGQ
ncbi:hypothetical protein C7M84_010245 [Penaeus vannamei]|uniref:Uncharacterized protein n=1 Tax=Penaeus vannamei TaxID=6689 RepID=A0A3R7MWM5_PENVA|nr:hypothetical protein C7M84_010245 [Penaeus vannamei]